jgi:hypothetical protein
VKNLRDEKSWEKFTLMTDKERRDNTKLDLGDIRMFWGLAVDGNDSEWNPVAGGFNTLNAELYPISHLLELLGAHPILHVSRIRVKPHSTTGVLII